LSKNLVSRRNIVERAKRVNGNANLPSWRQITQSFTGIPIAPMHPIIPIPCAMGIMGGMEGM
jgi:hypothetical protein